MALVTGIDNVLPNDRPESVINVGTLDQDHSVPSVVNDHGPASTAPPLRSKLSWKSFRTSLSLSERSSAQLGWAVAFLSVLFTVIALSPAFKSQNMTERALKLAEWTALKDYIEECREEMAAGLQSQACLKAINAKVPPPPYVKPGILDGIKRGVLRSHQELNRTTRGLQVEYGEFDVPKVIQGLIFLGIILTACVFLFLSFEKNRTRLRSRSFAEHEVEPDQEEVFSLPMTTQNEVEKSYNTSIRHSSSPTNASLRYRTVRTHPIYRHANLEEAIHHEDLEEIRTRLQNGEDVNKHWPYLIYRLAITPPSVESSKRIEIARICLDFGADVNVKEAWNGQSALAIAIHFGNIKVAKLLIVNGATVWSSSADSNLTALHHCVRLALTGSSRDSQEIMKMLFQYGANANQPDRLGETPLHKLLIDAWFQRHDDRVIGKLYPVALILLENGARMPETIKEKHVIGNPIWDLVHTAIWQTEWPDLVGPSNHLHRVANGEGSGPAASGGFAKTD